MSKVKKPIIILVVLLVLGAIGFSLLSYLVVPSGNPNTTEQERKKYESLAEEARKHKEGSKE
jgi:flagellar basal body-associated protein FliL